MFPSDGVMMNIHTLWLCCVFFLLVSVFLVDSYDILTHWGRVTHICVGNLTIIGSDNGLSPGRRQAIIWTNAGILLIGPLGTNFSEILIEIPTFSCNKMHLKMSSAKWRPFCPGLNELTHIFRSCFTCTGQLYCWPCTNEVNLKYRGGMGKRLTTTKHNQAGMVYITLRTYCL